jgi:hypothetical protein
LILSDFAIFFENAIPGGKKALRTYDYIPISEAPMLLFHPSPTPASIRQSRTLAKQICHGIAGLVAAEFGLDAAAVTSSTRGAPRAAYARQVAMYLAHVGFALSFETIGRAFDRDRTTIAHACRVV